MHVPQDIPQGCFSENWTPLPSELNFPLFSPISPTFFGHDFNQLLIIVGPSNLVCMFYTTFYRGVFREIGPYSPRNRIFSPFPSFPPYIWSCFQTTSNHRMTFKFGMHVLYDILQGCFSRNWTLLPSKQNFFPFSLFPPIYLVMFLDNF